MSGLKTKAKPRFLKSKDLRDLENESILYGHILWDWIRCHLKSSHNLNMSVEDGTYFVLSKS